MKGFCLLFWESFDDTILRVLIAAAVISLAIGIYEDPAKVHRDDGLAGGGGGREGEVLS